MDDALIIIDQAVLAPIVRGTDNLLPECLRNTGIMGTD